MSKIALVTGASRGVGKGIALAPLSRTGSTCWSTTSGPIPTVSPDSVIRSGGGPSPTGTP